MFHRISSYEYSSQKDDDKYICFLYILIYFFNKVSIFLIVILIDDNAVLFYSPERLYCQRPWCCLLFVSGSECLCCIIWTTLWFPLTGSRHPSLECYKRYKKCYAHGTRTRDQENTNLDQLVITFHNNQKRGGRASRTITAPALPTLKFEKKSCPINT